jgi:putative ATP-binding cassette transporter
MLACFVGVLWSLSGTLTVAIAPGMAVGIPGYLVWAAVAYAALGTLLTYLLGRPLVRLNQDRLSHEADFRFGLVRVREGGNRAKVSRGENEDRRDLRERFARVIATWRQLMLRTRRLNYMTSGYAVIATGLPVLIAAPHYFAHCHHARRPDAGDRGLHHRPGDVELVRGQLPALRRLVGERPPYFHLSRCHRRSHRAR